MSKTVSFQTGRGKAIRGEVQRGHMSLLNEQPPFTSILCERQTGEMVTYLQHGEDSQLSLCVETTLTSLSAQNIRPAGNCPSVPCLHWGLRRSRHTPRHEQWAAHIQDNMRLKGVTVKMWKIACCSVVACKQTRTDTPAPTPLLVLLLLWCSSYSWLGRVVWLRRECQRFLQIRNV